jgi:hypothetical protein
VSLPNLVTFAVGFAVHHDLSDMGKGDFARVWRDKGNMKSDPAYDQLQLSTVRFGANRAFGVIAAWELGPSAASREPIITRARASH